MFSVFHQIPTTSLAKGIKARTWGKNKKTNNNEIIFNWNMYEKRTRKKWQRMKKKRRGKHRRTENKSEKKLVYWIYWQTARAHTKYHMARSKLEPVASHRMHTVCKQSPLMWMEKKILYGENKIEKRSIKTVAKEPRIKYGVVTIKEKNRKERLEKKLVKKRRSKKNKCPTWHCPLSI